jgi:hypothetical protein
MTSTTPIPRWLWSRAAECVVEVLSTGHYPDSLMVRTPDGKELEAPCTDLEIPEVTKR